MKGLRKTTVIFLLVVVFFVSPAADASVENPMRIVTDENVLSVYTGDAVVLRYCYQNVPFKPYVQQLFSPAGVNVLRDAPADHLHHHGLMFAVAVDGVNFWEEQQAPGRQAHRAFADTRIDRRDGVPVAAFTERLNWVNPGSKELLLKESRTIEVSRLAEPAVTILTWESKLEVPVGKEFVTLSGSPYFGLGVRFLQSIDVGGQFHNAAGKTGVQETNDKQATWCAYSAGADGKPVTIAMFDNPDNERHPAMWFTMDEPFAYLSATLGLHKEQLKVTASKPLVVRYGVAVWDGQVQPEQIDKLYKRWAGWRLQSEKVEN
ncbi:MAG: PmoA family protein [Planctomycetota bacterium]|nr:PmoA family protein [Planctomycetota bacterium]